MPCKEGVNIAEAFFVFNHARLWSNTWGGYESRYEKTLCNSKEGETSKNNKI